MVWRARSAAVLGLFAVSACLAGAATAADRIYWGNETGDSLSYANLDGSGGANLVFLPATVDGPLGTAIDAAAGRIYWVNSTSNEIRSANLEGSGGSVTLNTTGASTTIPSGLAIYPAIGRIFWPNFSPGDISFARLDGTGGADFGLSMSPYISNARGIAVDPLTGRLYWTNAAGPSVAFTNLNGSGGSGLLNTSGATISNPRGIAVDSAGGRVYWSNRNANTISFANLNGSGAGDLNTMGATVNQPFGVAVDKAAGRIYWANYSGTTISYARLDGSGGGDLNTTGATLAFPNYPVILKAPDGTKAPSVKGAATVGFVHRCSGAAWLGDSLGLHAYRVPRLLGYQWRRNGVDIPGAVARSFTPRSIGRYACRVAGSNAAGATTQTSATRIVRRPCVVPRVVGKTLRQAKAALKRAHCRVGRVGRAFSASVGTGRVVSQRPRAGRRLANAAKVNVVVSRGPR